MRKWTMPLALVLALAVLAPVSLAMAESVQVYAHFFTVPTVLPGGLEASSKFPVLKKRLAELAGGYTQLGGGEGGWKNEKGQVETERTIAFVVSADRDISADIAALIKKEFGQREPFVLVTPAARVR